MPAGVHAYLFSVYDADVGIFFRLHLSPSWIAFGSVVCSVFIMIHDELSFRKRIIWNFGIIKVVCLEPMVLCTKWLKAFWIHTSFFAWCVFPGGNSVFLLYLPWLVLGVIRCRGKLLFCLFLFHGNAPLNTNMKCRGLNDPRSVIIGGCGMARRHLTCFYYLSDGLFYSHTPSGSFLEKAEPLSTRKGTVINDHWGGNH